MCQNYIIYVKDGDLDWYMNLFSTLDDYMKQET